MFYLFYHYAQNNSGGSFDYDETHGITHHVIIEADNDVDADDKAEAVGIYFDGVADGRDCPCCGDRWYPAHSGNERPMVYGDTPSQYVAARGSSYKFMAKGREVCVHYADGRKEWF